MSDDTPPAQQCTMPSCTTAKVDPTNPAGLCPKHTPDAEDNGVSDQRENTDNVAHDEVADNSTVSGENNDESGEESGSPDVNPTPEPAETTADGEAWEGADFTDPQNDVYPPALLEREQWMGRKGKLPFAPWGDRDADLECNNSDHDAESTAECDCDARYKWGHSGHYVDGDRVSMAEVDPQLDGRVFLQADDDPFVFVDGDDVRCPETGDVHPEFVRVLEALGATYADISTSGSGAHANYRGELPEGVKQATFPIDTEPWGANDDVPEIEIYDGKHVCVTTGEHVPGTPADVREWDADAVEEILDEFDQLPDATPSDPAAEHEAFDAAEYDADATESDEASGDIRDIFAALDRLDARRVAEKTIVHSWNESASTSGDNRAFAPTWGPSATGTANIVDTEIWQDTGGGGYGGPVVMALIDAGEVRPNNATPRVSGETWWRGIEHLRSLGFDIPEYKPDDDAEPVAPLALERLDAVADHERDRVAKRHGVEIPSTDDARTELRDTIMREMRAGNKTVIDAPTALGKSYTVATEPWILRSSTTGEAPVVHLHATTDARDEAAAESDRVGNVDHAVLKGRKERCPVARGDYDPTDDPEEAPDQIITIAGEAASEWLDRQCDHKGVPFSTAHALAREYNDQGLDTLPCCEEGDCPATAQWNGVPRDGEGNPAKDVIHATHQFAHVPSLRQHTNVVFDEQPDFSVDLTESGDVESRTARVRSMVNAYLEEIDAPAETWEHFIRLARANEMGGDVSRRDKMGDLLKDLPRPEPEWFINHPDAHALAPDLTRAVWQGVRWEDADENGRWCTKVVHEPPRFDSDGEGFARTYLSVVLDRQNNVRTIRTVPGLSQARSVIGLDAHPSMPLWQLNAHPEMTRDAVLDPTPRRLWRRYERGLTVVQVGEATRPRSGSRATEWMNDDRVRAVIRRLRDHYGEAFKTAITTTQVERQVRSLLAEVDDRVTPDHTMHYGAEKSRNDFGDETAGLLYGCMDPGDEMILDALAELGLEAQPETAETDDGDTVRAKGRGFTGPDADTADSVLASVRENHVAQAAGRYARNPDDPESSAVVFTMTDAHPTGFADVETPGVEWLATDLQREIIDALAERPSATAREIADTVDCTKEHVRQTLAKLDDEDLVEREEGAGDYGADVYRGQADEAAAVDMGVSEIANDPLHGSIRWSLVISPTDGVGGGVPPGESSSSTGDRGLGDDAAGGAPPG